MYAQQQNSAQRRDAFFASLSSPRLSTNLGLVGEVDEGKSWNCCADQLPISCYRFASCSSCVMDIKSLKTANNGPADRLLL